MAQTFTTSCTSCGATVRYLPGTTSLQCASCGSQTAIDDADHDVATHAVDEWAPEFVLTPVAELGASELNCRSCGAVTISDELSTECQFCGGVLVVVDAPDGMLPPGAVVPFAIDEAQATEAFRRWISNQKVAPDEVQQLRDAGTLRGTYLPAWRIDLEVEVAYRGRTRDGGSEDSPWREQAGVIRRRVDSVEIPASTSIARLLHRDMSERMSAEKKAEFESTGGFEALGNLVWTSLGPWDSDNARPFQPEYLVGYSTLRYDVDPQAAVDKAVEGLRPKLHEAAHDDLGGEYQQAEGYDREALEMAVALRAFMPNHDGVGLEEFRGRYQRLDELDVTVTTADVTQVLLPVWVGGYHHDGDRFPVHVNARTGEVEGPRTVSSRKFLASVLSNSSLGPVVPIAAVVAAALIALSIFLR